MALSVLITGVLLLAIDGTVLYLAVPSLSRELEPTAEQLLWIGDIYSLALAGLLVIMGTASDRVGRKRLLLIGVAAFGLSSLLAAFAATPETLIAARALLGRVSQRSGSMGGIVDSCRVLLCSMTLPGPGSSR